MYSFFIEIKWAVIFIVMMMLWMLGERMVGLHDVYVSEHYIYTNFVAIPAIAIFIFALREKRNQFYEGKITYKQSLKSGVIMTCFITLFSPVSQLIVSDYITPHFFENVISYAVSENKMTLPEAKAYFNLENYILQSLLFTPIMGIITTLLVSLYIRKR